MRKLLETINLKSSLPDSQILRIITACLVATLLALLVFTIFPKILAEPIDTNMVVKPALNPLIKLINDSSWSELMIFFICGGAVIGERCFTINKKGKGRENMSP